MQFNPGDLGDLSEVRELRILGSSVPDHDLMVVTVSGGRQ
jgi:hypothetical protein